MKIFQNDADSKGKREDPYHLGHFRILIVEDSSFISGLMFSCLLQMGVGEVIRAFSSERAKEKISKFNGPNSLETIDIVLLDWLMPDENGSELIKWMRNSPTESIKFLPVIVCSAFADSELVIQSRDLGANEVLVKPVSAEEIATRILRVIDLPRPYVQSQEFFGPDRRRKTKKYDEPERRVKDPQIVKESDE